MFTVCQALTHFISFNPRNSPLGEVLELVPFIDEETEHIEINNLPKVQSGDGAASTRTRGGLTRATVLTCLGAFDDKR